jgi:hypothetical protein
MNYLAAILLINIEDETKTFWCLVFLLHRKNWRMIFNDKMPKLMNMLNLVEQKLLKEDPKLLNHMSSQSLDMVTAFSPIFISLFIYQVPIELGTRIFEYFIVEGETVLLKIIFNMLRHKRKKILGLFEGDLMSFMRTDIIVECVDELTLEQLVDF